MQYPLPESIGDPDPLVGREKVWNATKQWSGRRCRFAPFEQSFRPGVDAPGIEGDGDSSNSGFVVAIAAPLQDRVDTMEDEVLNRMA